MNSHIRAALEHARHELTTLHGLVATDTPHAYQEALSSGSDPDGAWNTYTEQTWKIDTSGVMQEIDALLACLDHPEYLCACGTPSRTMCGQCGTPLCESCSTKRGGFCGEHPDPHYYPIDSD